MNHRDLPEPTKERMAKMKERYKKLVDFFKANSKLRGDKMKGVLKTVRPGQIWRHYNGNEYRVLMLANTEGDDESKQKKYPPTVVYRGNNGRTWARRLDDWHRSMTLISQPTGENY